MPDESPLSILAICSRPLTDAGGQPIALLDVAEERRRVETAIRRAGDVARVHFLPEATTDEVKSALRDGWDVVHFTGHGTEDGRLLLEDGYGVAHPLSKQETARLFTGRDAGLKTPLVVLSACHSETVGRELHAAGVPAVVAVDARVPIADLAAIIFAGHFYAALARGWDVRRAFEDARATVALDPKVGDQRPPKDEQGNVKEPWSKRFLLIGDAEGGTVVRAGTRGAAARQAPPRVVGNLHARSANFVGRAREIVTVVKAFDEAEARRVCVYGSGGLGKTELARAVTRWYMERERVGAVLWASASHVEGEYKLRDLASLLGVAARVFRLPVTEQSMFEEQKRVVRDFLAGSRALVLLDNWETIEKEHRRELWDFALSLPEEVRVLVTSRDTLPAADARNIELDTLAPDDAVELFVNIARNAGYFDRNPELSAEELDTLYSICDRLSGYPLAIEVVAGQTVSRTLSDIWADLQSVPRNVLEGKDELTGEPRGIWTSLDLSYNVLPDPEQTLFRHMCVFLAPAPADDIAAVTDTPNPRPVLDTLVKRSLVRMREGAYSLLPIVRDYAQDKLTTAGQDPRELHERAAYHYSQKQTAEGALTTSDHLFELASRFELRHAAEAFAKYVWGFYYNLVRHGYWAEARVKVAQLINVARALDDKQMEAQSIGELGINYQNIGEYEYAEELYRSAQSSYEELDDKRGMAVSMHQLGNVYLLQGDADKALRLYQQSLELKKELGDKRGVAGTLHQLGIMAQQEGDYGKAEGLYQQSLEIRKELDDKPAVAYSLHQLATLQQLQGNNDEAAQLYHQSLEIKEKLKDKHGIATTTGQLGQIARAQGQMKEALRCFIRAFTIFEELHAPYRQSMLDDIASVRAQVGGEQFAAWLRELSTEAGRINELLEQDEVEFVKHLAVIAQGVVAARKYASTEQQAVLARQLAEVEPGARERTTPGVADFLVVLRGLLAGEDVGERIAALEEPLRGIAEQARAACEAEGEGG